MLDRNIQVIVSRVAAPVLMVSLLLVDSSPLRGEQGLVLAEVFRDLGFDEALEAAEKEGKLVLLDYYADWCVPCKEMDETTWVDPEVSEWIDEHAVALRLDADVEVGRAVEHGVISLPTALLLRADGSEIDRLTGYKSAEDLLGEIEEALTGKDAVARAKEKMEATPEDLSLHMRYGDALREAGRVDEALEQYLRCWDAPLAEYPDFQATRGSFLLDRLFELGEDHPPALEALEARRKMAEVALLRGDAEVIDEESAANLIFGYRSLSQKLTNDPSRSLDLFDRVVTRGERLAITRSLLLQELTPALLLDRRYGTLLAARAPEELFAEGVRGMGDHLSELDQGAIQGALRQHALEIIRAFVVRKGLDSFEILLGAGELERALVLAEQVVAFENSEETWQGLAARARRVGDDTTALELESRAD